MLVIGGTAGLGEALFIETDVRQESQVQAAVQRAADRYRRIHAAVNNAGIEGRFGPVQDATAEDFDQVIGVNLRGVWLGMKYEISHMLTHGGGAYCQHVVERGAHWHRECRALHGE